MGKQNYKILSVGGSIVIPKTGFDIDFLQEFRRLILSEVKKGQRFILVIGGGNTARVYQEAGRGFRMTKEELDWIGIGATVLNAQFVLRMFGTYAYKEVVTNPTKRVKTTKPLIIAAGWKPGCSTDKDAVLLAKTYKVKELFNLSNIEYAYTKDPNKYKHAEKIEEMDWARFRKEVVGNTWDPGKSAPFDPIASKEAQKLKLTVSILKGTDLNVVRKAITGKKFPGSRIHP